MFAVTHQGLSVQWEDDKGLVAQLNPLPKPECYRSNRLNPGWFSEKNLACQLREGLVSWTW